MVSAIGFVAFVIVLGLGTEMAQARIRRSRVEAFVSSRGWTLRSCRYRPRFTPHWALPYRVEVVDNSGHELVGTAWATGFIRRKVWIDW